MEMGQYWVEHIGNGSILGATYGNGSILGAAYANGSILGATVCLQFLGFPI